MEIETLVHADLDGEPVLVGRLWSRMRRDRLRLRPGDYG